VQEILENAYALVDHQREAGQFTVMLKFRGRQHRVSEEVLHLRKGDATLQYKSQGTDVIGRARWDSIEGLSGHTVTYLRLPDKINETVK